MAKELTQPTAISSDEQADCMIVFQSANGVGAVQAYDSAQHLGLYTEEDAQVHARQLAMNHPGTAYSIVRVLGTVLQDQTGAAALKSAGRMARTFDDLYSLAGVPERIRSRRFLPASR